MLPVTAISDSTRLNVLDADLPQSRSESDVPANAFFLEPRRTDHCSPGTRPSPLIPLATRHPLDGGNRDQQLQPLLTEEPELLFRVADLDSRMPAMLGSGTA